MFTRLSLSGCLFMALLGCESSSNSFVNSSSQVRLSLNDVAILLPYDSRPELLTAVPAINSIEHIFVDDKLLSEISSILGDDRKIHEAEGFAFGKVGDETFERDVTAVGAASSESPYRLVSIRVDPCVNELTKKAEESCEGNVRLVFQPLFLDGAKVSAKDSNIHAIYRLSSSEFAGFVASLRELRASAGNAENGEALLPHPVIAREGVKGPYFQGLMKLLKANLSLLNLKRIAFFGDTDTAQQGHWPMVAFNVMQGQAVRVPLDKLGKQEGEGQKNVQRLHGNHEHLEDPLPRGLIADSLFPVLNLKGDEAPEIMQALISSFMQTKVANSHKLDNPLLHDPMTADCASCHVAHIQRSSVVPEMKAMGIELPSSEIFQSKDYNLSSNVPENFSRISLQIFSYFKTFPKVAPRVVNDAAHSLELLEAKTL